MTSRLSFLAAAHLIGLLSAQSVAAQSVRFAAHHDYPSGYGPASIAVGDINGDGHQDLAVAHTLDNTVAVLRGDGQGTFQSPRSIYFGPTDTVRSVALGDFDLDGRLDLAVANSGSNTVMVLPGNGDGTFQPGGIVGAGADPGSVVVNDFNSDGRPDLAIVNAGSSNISLAIGNGNGTFQPVQTFPSGGGASFAVSADFNRDGRPDLAVAGRGFDGIAILLADANGTLQNPRIFSQAGGFRAWSIAAGDFNADGTPDLVAANDLASTVSVLLGNGDGTLHYWQSFDAGSGPTSIAAADFNGDGKPDLAVAHEQDGTIEGSSTVSVLLGSNNTTFDAPLTFSVGSSSWSIAAGDFDQDGAADLAVANTYSTTVSVLLGRGDGHFPAALTLRVGHNPESLAAADFNRDGHPDLAVSNAGSNTVSVLIANGPGTFAPAASFGVGEAPVFVTVGDFNGDGNVDLVLANYGAHDYGSPAVGTTVSVILGNGDGTFHPPRDFEAGSGPHGIAVADLNGDGIQDLAVADFGPAGQRATTVSVLMGNGDGTFQTPHAFEAGHGPTFVVAGDFDRDGVLDLAATNYDDVTVSVLRGNGDGSFQSPLAFVVGHAPKAAALGDFDGDHLIDLAVADHFSDAVSVLIGKGDGTFFPHQWYDTGRNPAWVAVGDLNGDGISDLAVANWFATTASILIGRGDGTFLAQSAFGAGAAVEKLVLADFNADSQIDVATVNYFAASVSILLNTTTALRTATPTFSPPGGVYLATQTVAINSATNGATIYYTPDGSIPTTSSSIYTSPILVAQTTTIRAMATASGMANSVVASATFNIKLPPPAFSPPAGTYLGTVTVGITAAGGANVHYTTDGSAPSLASPVATSPITLRKTTTIRAIATASGMSNSDEATATFIVQLVPPSFSPGTGTFQQPQTVTLGTTTEGATIHYTLDGSQPSTASPIYNGPINVSQSTTVTAFAVSSGMLNSAAATAVYTLQAAQPVFSPAGGSYLLPQLVTISSSSPGTTIYYTTDGSTPTEQSSRYTGPVLIVRTTTLRAIAVRSGWSPSGVANAAYQMLLP